MKNYLEKFCDLTDTEIIVLSGFDLEDGMLLKDIREKLVLTEPIMTKAKNKLLEKEFIEETTNYYDYNQDTVIDIKDKRTKAYKLVQHKEIEALEQLLYSVYLANRIHSTIMATVRDMFPYKGTPLDIDVISLRLIKGRFDKLLSPVRYFKIIRTDIFEELKIELGKWKSFFDKGYKKMSRLERFFQKLNGNPVDDWAVLNDEIAKNQKSEIEKLEETNINAN